MDVHVYMSARHCVLVINPKGAEYCVLVSGKDSNISFHCAWILGLGEKQHSQAVDGTTLYLQREETEQDLFQ